MTIRPGQSWGQPYDDAGRSERLETADDDASLARKLLDPDLDRCPISPQSGDVLRTLGLAAPRSGSQRWLYPIDVAKVTFTDHRGSKLETGFVAHLSIRDKPLSGLGPGLSMVLLNTPWMGRLRLGPRAHVNDGRLDLLEGIVGFRQRFEATRRARSGDHLPHPQLTVSRVTTWRREFDKAATVWLDGVRHPKISRVEAHIVADAGHVVA